jgi:hypothetical protein
LNFRRDTAARIVILPVVSSALLAGRLIYSTASWIYPA